MPCWRKWRRKPMERDKSLGLLSIAFDTEIPQEIYDALLAEMEAETDGKR